MKLESLKVAAKAVQNSMVKNSPTILTGLGIAGMCTSVVFAVRATPKAIELIDNENYFREHIEGGEVERGPVEGFDLVKLTWKCYIPTAAMCFAAATCIIGAHSINMRRSAALASLYSISEATLKEYQAKVVDTIGQNKETKIRDEIAQDRLDKNPMATKEVYITGKGDMLCYERLSGRYFKSNVEALRKTQNEFNQGVIRENWMTINDLYGMMGLDDVKLGNDMGWSTDNLLEFSFSSKIADDDSPCLVIDYTTLPTNWD